MSTFLHQYDEVVKSDLELLWSIQEYCYRNSYINEKMSLIVSKYPFKDIVMVIWMFAIVGYVQLGVKHFWVVVLNLIVCVGK